METKATGWTPGPWKTSNTGAFEWPKVTNADDLIVAEVLKNGGHERAVANARLIAAAPEMAELLERNQGIIMNALTSGHGLTPVIMADMREAFAAIRDLLAKVMGEQNAIDERKD